jgi:hypothetical protein
MWIVFYVAMAASLSAMANLMQAGRDENRDPYGEI